MIALLYIKTQNFHIVYQDFIISGILSFLSKLAYYTKYEHMEIFIFVEYVLRQQFFNWASQFLKPALDTVEDWSDDLCI